MFCNKCGAEIPEGGAVCPKCGERVAASQPAAQPAVAREAGPYRVFATIALVLSIIGLVFCWVPWMWFYYIAPLVLAILGLKSKVSHGKAVTALVLSIIDLVISLMMTFFLYALLFG